MVSPAPTRLATAPLPRPLVRPRRPAVPLSRSGRASASAVQADFGDDELCETTLPVPKWSPPSRAEMLEGIEDEEVDVLVIGGGATGGGVAMDAAMRGLKVVLVEKNDFASATSSRSTKLIHGGLRYLAQAFQSKLPPNSITDVIKNLRFEPEYLRIVSADLSERAFMLKSASFMAEPLPMLVPLYRWWEVPMFFVVGLLYDLIAGGNRQVPPSRLISRSSALFEVPGLREENDAGEKLVGGLVIFDGQQNDARMSLHVMLTAMDAGARCINYAEVEGLLHKGGDPGSDGARVTGALVRDRQSGKTLRLRAKQVVNACGVFSDAVRSMADPSAEPIMVPSYGTHLVLPDYASSSRMGLVWFTQDGRVLYLLPWQGSTVAGTTDTPGPISFEPEPTEEQVDFILEECSRVVRERLGCESVRAAWSGIRPLIRDPNAAPGDTSKLSRDHVVDSVAGGLITIAGGKWTTYRKMAEDAVDACVRANPELKAKAQACSTLSVQLVGADRNGEVCGKSFDRIEVSLREGWGVSRDTAKHLRLNYGTRALQVVELARDEADKFTEAISASEGGCRAVRRLHPNYPQIEAEVAFACRSEFAMTAVDVLAQRTRLAFLDAGAALESLPRVLEIMAEEFGWDADRREAEEEKAINFLETMALPQCSVGDGFRVSPTAQREPNSSRVSRAQVTSV